MKIRLPIAAYLAVDTNLTNPEAYEEYKTKALPLAERHCGEYLAINTTYKFMFS